MKVLLLATCLCNDGVEVPCFGVASNALALIDELQNYFPRTEKQVRNVVFAPLKILMIDKLCNIFYLACVF